MIKRRFICKNRNSFEQESIYCQFYLKKVDCIKCDIESRSSLLACKNCRNILCLDCILDKDCVKIVQNYTNVILRHFSDSYDNKKIRN